eukprot:6478700-Amphidinium_carterae.1
MPTAQSEEPEGEPEWAVVSPASSRSSLLPPSGSPRLPTRLSAQSLLRGQLFVPHTGELYVVWALHDSPFGAQQYCGLCILVVSILGTHWQRAVHRSHTLPSSSSA